MGLDRHVATSRILCVPILVAAVAGIQLGARDRCRSSNGGAGRYVIANDSQITFVATSAIDPGSTLARGHSAQWWMATDYAGFPQFHLLFPEHDGYGGDLGDDIYDVQ